MLFRSWERARDREPEREGRHGGEHVPSVGGEDERELVVGTVMYASVVVGGRVKVGSGIYKGSSQYPRAPTVD